MTEKTVKEVEVKPVAKLEEEGDIAADYLEGLLDIADLDGDIDIDVENGRAALAIVGGKLNHLVGDQGQVLDALMALPQEFRTAVYLADAEGFSYAEIAEIVGVPLGTVMSRIHRGRKRLREALREHAIEMGVIAAKSEDES